MIFFKLNNFGVSKLVWVYSYIFGFGAEKKVQFFLSREGTIEKTTSVRLKAYV